MFRQNQTRRTSSTGCYGLPLDCDRQVHELSVGERQRTEIVRCLLAEPKLLILDEPTSVLAPVETTRLFETLRALVREDRAVLFISHKLEEVRTICDRATILRGGRVVAECDPRAESARSMAELMIGAKIQPPQRTAARASAAPRLSVTALSLPAEHQFGVDLHDIDLDVAGGEVMGVAGVAGNGQPEFMSALIGERRIAGHGEAIRIDGHPVADRGPAARRALGAAFVPEERFGQAAVAQMSLAKNALLTTSRRKSMTRRGLIAMPAVMQFARDIISAFEVRTQGADADAASLSGGNMQRFVVGREILQEPNVLVVSQPTWGVDAGAAARSTRRCWRSPGAVRRY